MRKFKWSVVVAVTVVAGLLVACKGNTDDSKQAKETTKTASEQSTRTPNSVVGKWYVYEEYDPDEVYIWEFEEGGKYYFATEEGYYKQGDNYIISKDKYTVDDNQIVLDGEKAKLEFTDYGFCVTHESGSQTKLYENRQEALESSDAYYRSELYLETLKDENGCIIQDGVLLAYFTDDKNIVIPDVKEIGGGVIISKLEDIDSITIPGCVEKIGNGAFGETPVDKIYIEEGVKEIGNNAFSDCYFDELHIPASVETIGRLAFSCEESNYDGKIYVKKGSYAEEFLKDANFDGEVIVE